MKKVYLFDLDSTVTKEEILPTISKVIGKEAEMRELTEKTMMGDLLFEESFRSRVNILKDISVDKVSEMVSQIKVNEEIVKFLNLHKDNCYIVTSNLDVWIEKLMKKIGMENNYFCSKAIVEDDKIKNIENIIRKEDIVDKFDCNVIAIGDGSNDQKMLESANIGIGFGGVRNIAPVLLDTIDYAIYDEKKLCDFLEML